MSTEILVKETIIDRPIEESSAEELTIPKVFIDAFRIQKLAKTTIDRAIKFPHWRDYIIYSFFLETGQIDTVSKHRAGRQMAKIIALANERSNSKALRRAINPFLKTVNKMPTVTKGGVEI